MSVQLEALPRTGGRHRRPPPSAGVGGAARFAGAVLTDMVLLVGVVVLAVAVVVPRIGGATPYTILTGSMRPTYPPGTMVVIRPALPDDIGTGTVITYQIAPGQPAVVTHRVIAVARHPDGDMRFQTKGDANNAVDEKWVRPEQVRGALWYAVPYLGYGSQLLTGEQRRQGVMVIAVVLLGYAGVMVSRSVRDRRRARRAA